MPKEIPSSSISSGVASYFPSMDTLSAVGWQAANFITILTATSTAVAAAQCPLNSLLANRRTYNQLLPPRTEIGAGTLAAVRSLYVGFVPSLAGSSARSAYVTGVKKNGSSATEESSLEEEAFIARNINPMKPSLLWDMCYVAAASAGEMVFTQIPESLSGLQKFNVISPAFNWRGPHNLLKLAGAGVGARFSGTMVNFYALCEIEAYLAHLINIPGSHLIAGAFSGGLAAVFSWPFTYYRDTVLLKSSVVDGCLMTQGFRPLAAQAIKYLQTAGYQRAASELYREFAAEIPVRLIRSAATFAIVSQIGATLGPKPLNSAAEGMRQWGMFSRKQEESMIAPALLDDIPTKRQPPLT